MFRNTLVFFKSFKQNFKRLLLYSICICLSTASVLIVRSASNVAFDTINTELDAVMFDGIEVSFNSLSFEQSRQQMQETLKESGITNSPVSSCVGEAHSEEVVLIGIGKFGADIFSLDMHFGSFFNHAQVDFGENVCVISDDFANEVFATDECIGNPLEISINGIAETFRVMGVYSKNKYVSNILGFNDEKVYIPYTVMQDMADVFYQEKYLLVNNPDIDTVVAHLASEAGSDELSVNDVSAQRKSIDDIFATVTAILMLITGTSVIVACFSLMVIMLLNVKSSYKEIGLKKSLGASKGDILCEYMVQAATISVIGSVAGVLINSAFCIALNFAGFVVRPDVLITVVTVAVIIVLSTISSIIPAYIAASYRPIDTIRGG